MDELRLFKFCFIKLQLSAKFVFEYKVKSPLIIVLIKVQILTFCGGMNDVLFEIRFLFVTVSVLLVQ